MKNAWIVSFMRFPILIMLLLLFFLLYKGLGLAFHFPFLPEMSTVYFNFANLVCFILLHRILKQEGRSIKELVGFQRHRLGKDILFGFLWLFVLYIPFVIAVIGTMFVLFGTELFNQFQIVFAGNDEVFEFVRPMWLLWFSALISLVFPFLNAPIEELMYRGYAQPSFIRRYRKVWLGILIPAVGFAIQHVMLAGSFAGMIVYAVAFFVWGLCSGFIYYKQQRLLPLIVCHFIVNMAFSAIPIAFLIAG